MLYLFNQNEELQTILKEYKEASHTEQLNKDNFFEFWVPANHPDSQFIKEENFVAFKDEDGELRLFVIKELEEVHDDVLYKEVFCKAAWMDELEDEVLEESNAQDQTMEDALSEALQSTRWQVGEVAELGLNDADFYFESVLSAINKILSTWGGEVKDRIVISDNQITDRYIDILPRRGADTGKTLSISKDLQSIHRTVVSYPKTALYGRGKGEEGDGSDKRLTFEEVEWSTEKGDPVDKPLGQKWVGDPEALKKYGRENFTRHRFDFFDSSDEEDPKQLLTNTWNALQEKNQILVSYDLSAISLEKIAGLEHEKVRLGDTVFIIDREFVPEILVEGRVIELKRVRNEPERTEIKLGNFLPLYTDDTRLDDVVDTINNNSGKWSSVDDSNFPDIEPPVPINVQATGAFRSIIIEWDLVPDLYIANYEVFASQVKGFHPDSSNLVFRGKTSICSYNADVNEQWYFRVRAVNTHGTQSDFSKEVSDTTARIISDDILFGEEIAEELRELSENAEILAGGTVGIDKMKEEALEAIQETAKKYTDEEIQEAEEAINKELAEKAGLNYVDGEFSLVNSELSEMLGDINLISGDVSGIDSRVDSLQNTSDDLRSRVSENEEELLANDGRVTTVERDIDEVEGTLYTTINSLSNVENTIENQQTQIDANATEINLKASEGALNTVTGDVREVQSELSVQAGQIEAKAESAELTIVDGKVAGVQENLASLEVSVDGISTSVESLQVDLDGLEIGGRNLLRNSLLVDNHSNNSNIYPVDKEVFEDYHRYTSREGASNPLINLYNSIPSTDITDGSWQDNDITASVNVRTDLEDAYIRIRLYDTQNTDDTILETVVVPVPTGIWTRISITAPNVSQNLKDDSIVRVMLQASNSSGSAVSMVGKYLDIGGFKIEKGNKATDWTPAPEDIDSSIENVQQYASSIDQKADSISLEVSELEQTVDGNTASISNAESSITQLATSIVLKAEQDQVDTIDGEVTTVKSQVSELTVDIDGIYTSVSSLEIDLDDLGTRVESSESSITQLSDSIDLTVKELDIVDGRMTEAEASLKVQAGQIELKVEEDEIISSINQTAGSVKIKAEMIELDGDVYLDGGTTYIRDGAIGSAAIKNGVIENAHLGTAIIKTAQIAEGAIEKAQIGEAQIDSSHIGELSADKIKSGTLDASNITIFGGTTNDYTKIEGSFFESRGKFERTWRGLTETHDIKMKFERGYLRARNDSKNWSLYFSDYGISTFADGSGDDSSSGTIAFHDKSYSDTAMGLTMHSNSGVIGLRSEKNKIMLDANSTVYIDSEVANVYIRPLRTSRVGNNEFKFSVKLNSSPSDTDGWIAYGSPGTNFACGLRFKKTTVGDPTVYVTNGNGDKNTGALEANKVKAREIGNLSSRTFKTNIEKMNDNGLDLVNQLTIVKYDLISDLEKGEFNNRQVGLISEDSPSVATTDGIAINMYKLVSYNVKATQELSTKSNDQDKRINDLKIENQLLKARIQTLEEAI